MLDDLIVLKFGSSVLASPADLPAAVHEIYRWYRSGRRVVAVVSALAQTTERLLSEARALAGGDPEPHGTAELLATGERHCAALLGIALDRAGIAARVVDPREIGLTASGALLDAEPSAVDVKRVHALLDETPVIVVPGFFGYGADARLRLLGRGGSDLSAVYLSTALGAKRCRLLKDVDGVYESDPAEVHDSALRRYSSLSYADALEHAAPLIQPKAVRFLDRHSASAEVAAIGSQYESTIGRCDLVVADAARAARLAVLILGLGTVGLGVYQRLTAMPEHFRIVRILVRDRDKYEAQGIAPELLCTSPEELGNVRADVVVDALPGLEPSHTLARTSLERRISVVSANKTLIAETGPTLHALAKQHGAHLRYCAAVGGGAPMIEALDRSTHRGEIRALAGILNGTCNYVLDRCAEGLAFEEAVRAAQAAGFAEADPTEDLSGRDASRKLRILVRHAFDQELHAIRIEPLSAAAVGDAGNGLRAGQTLRQIARAWTSGNRILAQIQLEAFDADDPFADTRGEWNKLIVTRANSEVTVISGRGAGRWPTAESVVADLLDVRSALSSNDAQNRRDDEPDRSLARIVSAVPSHSGRYS